MEELLELEPLPAAALTGVAVARDRHGLYVAKAPRSLRVRPGDRLLSARVVFEGAPPEEVARLLEGARSCRVGLQLRRPPGRPPSPGGRGHPGAADGLSPTPPKKPPPAPGAASAAAASAVAVEFALPKLPRLGKSRSVAEPAPAAAAAAAAPEPPPAEPKRPRATLPRLTVKEAAAGKTPAMEEPPAKPAAPAAAVPAGPGARFPAVEVAVPKVAAGLSLTGATPPAPAPAKEPVLRLPRLEVAVPALPLPVALPEPGAAAPPPPLKGAGSPVPKAKAPKAAAPVTGEEGDAGARGGFAAIHVPSIGISVPSAAVELLPERGGTKPEPPAAPGLLPRLEVKLPARRSESPPAAPAQAAFPVPAVELAVPRVGAAPAEAAAAAVPEAAARFAKGLRKLSLELEPAAALPAAEIPVSARAPAAKPPRFALPRVALTLGKLKPGGDGTAAPPAARGAAGTGPVAALDLAGAAGVKLKVPKVSLAPFGAKEGDGGAGGREGARSAAAKLPWLGTGGARGDAGGSAEPGSPRLLRVPRVGIALPVPGSRRSPSLPRLPAGPEAGGGLRLPRFGGSSPDLRPGGDAGAVRRGGSAESLTVGAAGRRMPEPPGVAWWKPKGGWAVGDGGGQPVTARFTVPAVGFSAPVTAPESWKPPRAAGAAGLKVPALELAPPGREERPGSQEAAAAAAPKGGSGWAGGALEAEGRMRMAGVRKAVSALVRPKEKRDGDGDAAGAGGARPHLNGEAEGRGRRRPRWVPRVGFTPGGSPEAGEGHGDPQLRRRPPVMGGGPGGAGTPRFQLPKLELSPQTCGEW